MLRCNSSSTAACHLLCVVLLQIVMMTDADRHSSDIALRCVDTTNPVSKQLNSLAQHLAEDAQSSSVGFNVPPNTL